MPDRRALLRVAAIAVAVSSLMGHTPFRHWQVYRRKHLLIGTHKEDPENYPLGKEIARSLAERLPESRARVTRGPDALRLATLLMTDQLEVVLLRADEVDALAAGDPPFETFGGAELRTLARAGSYYLVVRTNFPAHHAWQITAELPALLEPVAAPSAPLHEGVLQELAGRPMPDVPTPPAEEAADHVH